MKYPEDLPSIPVNYAEEKLFSPEINHLVEKRLSKRFEKIRRDARDFSEKFIYPSALKIDWIIKNEDHDYTPWDIVKEGMKRGYLSFMYPKVTGGKGGLTAEFAVLMEELSAACPGIANIFGANALGAAAIVFSFNPDIWERYLVRAVEAEKMGEPVIFAWAITEPSAGSDVEYDEGLEKGTLTCEAKPVVGGFRLSGRKVFISNGSIAKYIVVKAATDKKRGRETWSTFIVSSSAEGFRVVRTEYKMGQVACPAAELEFDEVFISRRDTIGPVGSGRIMSKLILAASRGPVGAISTGIALGAFRLAAGYAMREDTPYSRSIRNPVIREILVEMFNRIRTARLSYLEATSNFDKLLLPPRSIMDGAEKPYRALTPLIRRENILEKLHRIGDKILERYFDHIVSSGKLDAQYKLASSAKVIGSDTAVWVASRALDIIRPGDHPYWLAAQKLYRDAKLVQIYEGTNQLNKQSIGNFLLTG